MLIWGFSTAKVICRGKTTKMQPHYSQPITQLGPQKLCTSYYYWLMKCYRVVLLRFVNELFAIVLKSFCKVLYTEATKCGRHDFTLFTCKICATLSKHETVFALRQHRYIERCFQRQRQHELSAFAAALGVLWRRADYYVYDFCRRHVERRLAVYVLWKHAMPKTKEDLCGSLNKGGIRWGEWGLTMCPGSFAKPSGHMTLMVN